MNWKKIIPAAVLALPPALAFATGTSYLPSNVPPPPPAREFRAAWITEVAANPDWPSKPGLPVAQQKMELAALLDRAQKFHLNAVFFQVRTGVRRLLCLAPRTVVRPPHRRGWASSPGTVLRSARPSPSPRRTSADWNCTRGSILSAPRHPPTKSPPAPNHITRTHPELVRHYGDQVWLDPGEPEAQARTLAVVLDVVKRYDVDGIVFDDYFYPYPLKNRDGRELDFPDDASWKKYGTPTAA